MSRDVNTLEKVNYFGMVKNVTASLGESSRANSLLSIYDKNQVSPNRGGPVLGENLGCSLKASHYLTPDYNPNISEHIYYIFRNSSYLSLFF